ncbi:MAG: YqaA family protein, partial [Candidatus Hinthialibacter sp.]
VLGGAVGYCIGYYGGRPLVEWLVRNRWIGKIFTHEKFEVVESYYQKYDFWAVLIAAFTPIPYKIFTIGGGLCRIHFWRFMLVSTIGRSGRFFIVGTLLYFFGRQAQFLVKRFDLFLAVMLVLVVIGFLAMRFLKPAPREEKNG